MRVRCDPSFVDRSGSSSARSRRARYCCSQRTRYLARLVQLLHIWRARVSTRAACFIDADRRMEHSQEECTIFIAAAHAALAFLASVEMHCRSPLPCAPLAVCLPAVGSTSTAPPKCRATVSLPRPRNERRFERSERPQPPHRQRTSRDRRLHGCVTWCVPLMAYRRSWIGLEAEGGTREMLSEDEGELIVGPSWLLAT